LAAMPAQRLQLLMQAESSLRRQESRKTGKLPQQLSTVCLELHSIPRMVSHTAVCITAGATPVAVRKEAVSSWHMTWVKPCARWALRLVSAEIRIWLSCASLANFTYVVQAFLAMGWYLLAVNKVNAELQYAVTKQLLIFSILLYYCFELHNQVRHDLLRLRSVAMVGLTLLFCDAMPHTYHV
jgi:hypothetical protein